MAQADQDSNSDDEPGMGPASSASVGADAEDDRVLNELRAVYRGVEEEPLPEMLVELLNKLDAVERDR